MHIRQFVNTLPAYFNFTQAYVGNFSLTTRKEKYILNEYAIDWNGERETPAYHSSKVLSQVRFPAKNFNSCSGIPYPYKVIPVKHPMCIYLDISQAYAQIAGVFGLECQWKEGGYFAYGETSPSELFSTSKLARALLVSGTGLQTRITEWKNNELLSKSHRNRNYAPYLRGAIYRVLHAVQSVISKYTIYAHTDGCIIRVSDFRAVSETLSRYHIQYSVKGYGPTTIYNVGSYQIGDKRTRTAGDSYYSNRSRENIRTGFDRWWLDQFSRGVELHGRYRNYDNQSTSELHRINPVHPSFAGTGTDLTGED